MPKNPLPEKQVPEKERKPKKKKKQQNRTHVTKLFIYLIKLSSNQIIYNENYERRKNDTRKMSLLYIQITSMTIKFQLSIIYQIIYNIFNQSQFQLFTKSIIQRELSMKKKTIKRTHIIAKLFKLFIIHHKLYLQNLNQIKLYTHLQLFFQNFNQLINYLHTKKMREEKTIYVIKQKRCNFKQKNSYIACYPIKPLKRKNIYTDNFKLKDKSLLDSPRQVDRVSKKVQKNLRFKLYKKLDSKQEGTLIKSPLISYKRAVYLFIQNTTLKAARYRSSQIKTSQNSKKLKTESPVSYTHLTLPTTPYV